MNRLEEYIAEENPVEVSSEENQRTQREIIAEKRRKRRQQRKLKNAIFMSCVLILMCVWGIAYLTLSDRNTYHETMSAGNMNVSVLEEESETKQGGDTFKDFGEYSDIHYFDEGKLDRYEAYREENPDMLLADVVWMVNANQDKPKYGYDIPVSGYDDPLIIVNKYYKVPEDYRPDDLVDYGGGQYLRKETGKAYEKMQADAKKEGFTIYVVSAYRSVDYQKNLYNGYLATDSKENVDRYSARAGYSEHHTGMAMDIFGSSPGLREFENTPEYPWVRDNCYKYGFIIRYQKETEGITGYESEPWHLRYVGVDVSTQMKEENINSFEEYHAKYLQNK